MRTKGIIGRRIVDVRQSRAMGTGGPVFDVDAIVLDNGVELRPIVAEVPNGSTYLVKMLVVRP